MAVLLTEQSTESIRCFPVMGQRMGQKQRRTNKRRIFLIKASIHGKMAARGDHDESIYFHQPSHRQCRRLR